MTETPEEFIEKKLQKEISVKFKGIRIINRNDLLKQKTPGSVIICPSKPDGIDFLLRYNAWGYVNISHSRKPKYFALYISAPKSAIIYFGEIENITKPILTKSEIPDIIKDDNDKELFEKGKRLILLKSDTLIRLENPIPYCEKVKIQSIRYVSLEDFVKANTIDDI